MKIICHKNNGEGLIKSPVIMISASSDEHVDDLISSTPQELEPCVLNAEDLPSDRVFFMAWELSNGKVTIDLTKAKSIGHDIRRAMREIEFSPLDNAIAKQIPNSGVTDADRQVIRDKYATIQTQIDAATTPEEIKAALNTEGA